MVKGPLPHRRGWHGRSEGGLCGATATSIGATRGTDQATMTSACRQPTTIGGRAAHDSSVIDAITIQPLMHIEYGAPGARFRRREASGSSKHLYPNSASSAMVRTTDGRPCPIRSGLHIEHADGALPLFFGPLRNAPAHLRNCLCLHIIFRYYERLIEGPRGVIRAADASNFLPLIFQTAQCLVS
jgi:hypothetical protein